MMKEKGTVSYEFTSTLVVYVRERKRVFVCEKGRYSPAMQTTVNRSSTVSAWSMEFQKYTTFFYSLTVYLKTNKKLTLNMSLNVSHPFCHGCLFVC